MALLSLSCVASGLREPRRARAERIAAEAGLERRYLDAGRFILTSFQRLAPAPQAELVVYLEGDGRAWSADGRKLAADPTPLRPVALELASLDPAASVVYLARPCQFSEPETARGCEPSYWSDRRYAPEVIDAIDAAVSQVRNETRADALHLVGFSGGGVVAALLAARRDDVASLTTVAAPLDLAAWTAHHELTPLAGSMNPADHVADLAQTPQRHLVGGRDAVVPPQLVESFVQRLPQGTPVRFEVLPDYDHRCCWSHGWPARAATD